MVSACDLRSILQDNFEEIRVHTVYIKMKWIATYRERSSATDYKHGRPQKLFRRPNTAVHDQVKQEL